MTDSERQLKTELEVEELKKDVNNIGKIAHGANNKIDSFMQTHDVQNKFFEKALQDIAITLKELTTALNLSNNSSVKQKTIDLLENKMSNLETKIWKILGWMVGGGGTATAIGTGYFLVKG